MLGWAEGQAIVELKDEVGSDLVSQTAFKKDKQYELKTYQRPELHW